MRGWKNHRRRRLQTEGESKGDGEEGGERSGGVLFHGLCFTAVRVERKVEHRVKHRVKPRVEGYSALGWVGFCRVGLSPRGRYREMRRWWAEAHPTGGLGGYGVAEIIIWVKTMMACNASPPLNECK